MYLLWLGPIFQKCVTGPRQRGGKKVSDLDKTEKTQNQSAKYLYKIFSTTFINITFELVLYKFIIHMIPVGCYDHTDRTAHC